MPTPKQLAVAVTTLIFMTACGPQGPPLERSLRRERSRLLLVLGHADTPATSSGCRLHHDRVADLFGRLHSVVVVWVSKDG